MSPRRVTEIPSLPERPERSHKNTFGRVLVIGGSRGLTGAVALAAEAAYRSGAGWVAVAAAASLEGIFEIKLTEALKHSLPEGPPGVLGPEAEAPALRLAEDFDVTVLGPGLGRNDRTCELARRLVARLPTTTVVDADALYALTDSDVLEGEMRGPRILTPHPGEMARLTGEKVAADDELRAAAALDFAARYPVTLVLKGFRTVVAEGDRFAVNETGGSALATAGTGDVLSGVIAGLAAQGMEPFDAARLGVHLHGRAGDLAAAELTPWAVMAGDVVKYLPAALREMAPDTGKES